MIRLSDYLDYLNKEIIQARKKADENAIQNAKLYAGHEYLKYFRVPRFTMPVIKIDIPLKITDMDSETKYEYKFEPEAFTKELNQKITTLNKEKNLNIPNISLRDIANPEFQKIFQVDFQRPLDQYLAKNIFEPMKITSAVERTELRNLFTETVTSVYRPVYTKLNELYVDPKALKEPEKEKLLVNLHVEMAEEYIRIVKYTDASGKEIEEITVE